MLFNSFSYLWFLPLTVLLYYVLPAKRRWILLLGASYYFYMCWKPEYVILIVASTVIDYIAGIGIERSETKGLKRGFLAASLTGNLSILFFFKYFNFFGENLQHAFDMVNIFYDVPSYHFLLPVGISFYTFQTMSYTIDVYRGKVPAERHFGRLAVYVSFFPQLVAGPIERSGRLLPQLRREVRFDPDRAASGVQLIIWGLFKKVVVADGLAGYVNTVYFDPAANSGFPLIIGTIFFAYQIYCDFSGYSDIAIGSARLLGIDLMKNFDTPYYSKSIREFWGRWHISLSTWFRDYVYIPLGGNRVKVSRLYINLMITFLVSGLWHGANWTFIVWGAIHGVALIFSLATEKNRERLAAFLGLSRLPKFHAGLKVVTTFTIVCISWVFFRADSMAHAMLVFEQMLLFDLGNFGIESAQGPFYFVTAVASIVVLELIQLAMRGGVFAGRVRAIRPAVRWGLVYVCLMAIVIFGTHDVPRQFLYFQF
ncbi:MAG: membrane-bound O-acyltransferase family protein [Ectothiorhodospiraceae bacterium]|nr:membrane-bound O-acyltransferase family protein [Ectothiorhodospiraceae bacterium]